MKKYLVQSLFLMTLGLSLAYGGDLPRGTFEFKDLEQAKAKAIESQKWIAYLYTEKNTTCPLCQHAADEFVDGVKGKAVLVYLPSDQSKTYWAKLSDELQKALRPGKFIPKMAVVDATSGAVVASINYDALKQDEDKAMRAFKKTLSAAKK
jgi:hypothetical protein